MRSLLFSLVALGGCQPWISPSPAPSPAVTDAWDDLAVDPVAGGCDYYDGSVLVHVSPPDGSVMLRLRVDDVIPTPDGSTTASFVLPDADVEAVLWWGSGVMQECTDVLDEMTLDGTATVVAGQLDLVLDSSLDGTDRTLIGQFELFDLEIQDDLTQESVAIPTLLLQDVFIATAWGA